MSESQVPFIANTKDDLHCHQACLAMIIAKHENYTPSWGELELLTGFKEGMLTWHMKSYIEMQKRGYKVRVVDSMDYVEFAKNPFEYLSSRYDLETAEFVRNKSDLGIAAREAMALLQSNVTIDKRVPEISDVEFSIQSREIVICGVNQKIIQGESGYIGHSVLVVETDRASIIAHNPGPPPEERQVIEKELFLKAWSSPNKEARSILAIRKA